MNECVHARLHLQRVRGHFPLSHLSRHSHLSRPFSSVTPHSSVTHRSSVTPRSAAHLSTPRTRVTMRMVFVIACRAMNTMQECDIPCSFNSLHTVDILSAIFKYLDRYHAKVASVCNIWRQTWVRAASVEYKKSPLAYGLITVADSKLPHVKHFLASRSPAANARWRLPESLHRFQIIV